MEEKNLQENIKSPYQNCCKTNKNNITAKIMSISYLLSLDNLNIPDYQRPYKWSEKNVVELLSDIKKAVLKKEKVADFKYRIGTIILHKNNDKYDIVDGQQRTITFALLIKALKNSFPYLTQNLYLSKNINKHEFLSIEKDAVKINYDTIVKFLMHLTDPERTSFIKSLKDILQVVVIVVPTEPEAFQLFDSQNYRGKPLSPHDLLKAYHLRTMESETDKKLTQNLVTNWESHPSEDLSFLFNDYLFPIIMYSQKKKWSHKRNKKPFTKNDIDIFYGIEKNKKYPFALHIYCLHSMDNPFFIINEPFAEGESFFNMTNYYINQIKLFDILLKEPYTSTQTQLNKAIDLITCFYNKEVNDYNGYAYNLFKQATFFYFNRFSSLDLEVSTEQRDIDAKIIKKIFIWAMMIRVNRQRLTQQTIKNYAIGEENGDYTNQLALFEIIAQAKNTDELLNIAINLDATSEQNKNNILLNNLKNLLNDNYKTNERGADNE